jgi:hypothetical protein
MHYYVMREGAPSVTASSVWESAAAPAAGAAAALPPVCAETPELAAALSRAGAVPPCDFDALARSFDDSATSAPPAGGGSSPSSVTAGGAASSAACSSGGRTPSGLGAPPATRRLRFRFSKAFHVSPFMSLADQEYEWVFSQPAAPGGDAAAAGATTTLLVQSQQWRTGPVEGGVPPVRERMLNTQLRMVGQELSSWRLAYLVLVAFPLLTFRVQWWIHVEAVRLWLKGVALHAHPTGATNGFVRAVEALFVPVVWLYTAWQSLGAPAGGARALIMSR